MEGIGLGLVAEELDDEAGGAGCTDERERGLNPERPLGGTYALLEIVDDSAGADAGGPPMNRAEVAPKEKPSEEGLGIASDAPEGLTGGGGGCVEFDKGGGCCGELPLSSRFSLLIVVEILRRVLGVENTV